MITISICLSDIPNSAVKKAESNGKVYVNLVVDKRKEADKYDNTHTVYISQSKEEREAKNDKKYVGNGKEYVFNNATTQGENPFSLPVNQVDTTSQDSGFPYGENVGGDDLPF